MSKYLNSFPLAQQFEDLMALICLRINYNENSELFLLKFLFFSRQARAFESIWLSEIDGFQDSIEPFIETD